jgi:hypothetical protein
VNRRAEQRDGRHDRHPRKRTRLAHDLGLRHGRGGGRALGRDAQGNVLERLPALDAVLPLGLVAGTASGTDTDGIGLHRAPACREGRLHIGEHYRLFGRV